MTGTRVFHTVTLEVLSAAGSPAVRASVEVSSADGVRVFGGLTDDEGKVTVALEQYREYGNGTRQNMTPHGVRIVTPGLTTETFVNATADKTERITLVPPPTGQVFGVTREAVVLIAAVLGLSGAAGALAVRRRLRRAAKRAEEVRGRGGRRRGPRAGR
jgi:hypothetical protein